MTQKGYRWLLAVMGLYWLVIFVLTHLPPARLPAVPVNDKLEHLGAYFILAALVNITLGQTLGKHRDWMTVAIILAYGAIDEWLQIPVGRSCELADWYADGAGVALAIFVCGALRALYAAVRPKVAEVVDEPVGI